jgi:hypothetical protein
MNTNELNKPEIKETVLLEQPVPNLISKLDKIEIQFEMKFDISEQNKILEEVKNGERKLENSQEKGNYGEMRTDQDLKEKGYDRISLDRVTDLNSVGHQGIDGVYYKEGGEPEYIIVDSKYGSAQLSETADGKQMSEKWIDNRLDNAVGKEKADEIRMEKLVNSGNVGSFVAHVSEDGIVTYERLDSNGDVKERNVQL